MNKHNELEQILSERLYGEKQQFLNEKERTKYEILIRLLQQKGKPLFRRLSIEMAKEILRDLGITESEQKSTYIALLREEVEGTDLDEGESRINDR